MGLFFMIILGQVMFSTAPQGPTRFEHLAGARNMFLFQNQKQGGGILNESNNNLIILIHLHLPNKLESSLSICDLHKLKRLNIISVSCFLIFLRRKVKTALPITYNPINFKPFCVLPTLKHLAFLTLWWTLWDTN